MVQKNDIVNAVEYNNKMNL